MARPRKLDLDPEPEGPKDIVVLLKAIPTETFLRMLVGAGLPVQQTRDLAAAFRKLKE